MRILCAKCLTTSLRDVLQVFALNSALPTTSKKASTDTPCALPRYFPHTSRALIAHFPHTFHTLSAHFPHTFSTHSRCSSLWLTHPPMHPSGMHDSIDSILPTIRSINDSKTLLDSGGHSLFHRLCDPPNTFFKGPLRVRLATRADLRLKLSYFRNTRHI